MNDSSWHGILFLLTVKWYKTRCRWNNVVKYPTSGGSTTCTNIELRTAADTVLLVVRVNIQEERLTFVWTLSDLSHALLSHVWITHQLHHPGLPLWCKKDCPSSASPVCAGGTTCTHNTTHGGHPSWSTMGTCASRETHIASTYLPIAKIIYLVNNMT